MKYTDPIPSHDKMTFADHHHILKQVSVTLDDMLSTFDVMAKHGVIDELDPIRIFIRTVAFGKPRVSQSRLDQGQRNVFNTAVQNAIQSGEYQRLAAIHLSATEGTGHDAHGFTGTQSGWARFLPWHRAYLLEMEKVLRAHEPNFRRIPYWDWTEVDPEGNPIWPSWVHLPQGVTRGPDTSRRLPNQQDISALLRSTTYDRFTSILEDLHGDGHMWVGGDTMPDPAVSPNDPIFWLHHANVDRIWTLWQDNNPKVLPPLSGAKAVMDPWTLTVNDLNEVLYLLYYYFP